jgi:hypothetical protein
VRFAGLIDDKAPCAFDSCDEPAAWELEYWSPIPSMAYACSTHLAALIPRVGETRVRPVVVEPPVEAQPASDRAR